MVRTFCRRTKYAAEEEKRGEERGWKERYELFEDSFERRKIYAE